MPITRNDTDQAFQSGTVVGSISVVRDVTAEVNGTDIRTKAVAALAANDTYRAIATPTNAQVVTQVDRLTRECSGIIRLLLSQLDTTAGT